MITIGLLGGVASGKSLVARMLAELGAGVLDADAAGHLVLDEPEVKQSLRDRWGDSVFAGDGSVDRQAVAQHVFDYENAAENRTFLEDLLHPRIGERLRRQGEQLAGEGARVSVLDAPLLLEAGWDGQCDLLVLVDSPRELRLERAQRRGWSPSQFDEREAAQRSVDEKRQRADAIVENRGDEQQLRQNVHEFWRKHVAPRLAASS
jgi:dephospho-CoA kinase